MSRRECTQPWHSVGYLTADRVMVAEPCSGAFAAFYLRYHLLESVNRLGGLRIQRYVAAEIHLRKPLDILYHDGLTPRLSDKADDLGETALAVDDYLLA